VPTQPVEPASKAMLGSIQIPEGSRRLDENSGFIPGGALEVAREQLTRVASKGGGTLGFTLQWGLRSR
jgi:membrane protein